MVAMGYSTPEDSMATLPHQNQPGPTGSTADPDEQTHTALPSLTKGQHVTR